MTRDARIREELGAWWAEEFPAVVMPTEALIRLSERLATFAALKLADGVSEPPRTPDVAP